MWGYEGCETMQIDSSFGSVLTAHMDVNGCSGTLNEVRFLEHVQCKVSLRFFPRGNLKILLTSPMGMTSTLLFERPRDVVSSNFDDWPFLSVHYWGEKAEGRWTLQILNSGSRRVSQPGVLKKWQLIFYGTATSPIRLRSHGGVSFPSASVQQSVAQAPFMFPQTSAPNPTPAESGGFYGGSGDIFSNGGYQNFPNVYTAAGSDVQVSLAPLDSNNKSLSYQENLMSAEESNGDDMKTVSHNCDPECDSQGCYGQSPSQCVACKHYKLDKHYRHYSKTSTSSLNASRFNVCVCGHSACVSRCPPRSFPSQGGSCWPCHESCETCAGAGQDSCVTCAPAHMRLSDLSVCLQQCPEGYYESEFILLGRELRKVFNVILVHAMFQTLNRSPVFRVNPTVVVAKTVPITALAVTTILFCMITSVMPLVRLTLMRLRTMVVTWSMASLSQYIGLPMTGRLGFESWCEACHASCDQCSGPNETHCVSCRAGRFSLNSTCVDACPDGYYADKKRKECLKCAPGCSLCASGGVCLQCADQWVLNRKNKCLPKDSHLCSSGQYWEDSQCLPCHPSCDSCEGPTSSDCLSCLSPLLLQGSRCLEHCLDGFFREQGMCVPCLHTCTHCLARTNCTQCASGLHLQNGECHSSCAPGYYSDRGVCTKCYLSCMTCSGPRRDQCVTCPRGWVLAAGECHPDCPEGFFKSDFGCQKCHHYCRTCKGEGPLECTSCPPHYMLEGGLCMECLGSQYYDTPTQLCKTCHKSCRACSGPGPSSCLACLFPSHLDKSNNQCVPCCLGGDINDCCHCDTLTGECEISPPADKRRTADSGNRHEEQQGSYQAMQDYSPFTSITALAIGGCVGVVALFAVMLSVLQMRSRESWRKGDGYKKLSTSRHKMSEQVSLTAEESDYEDQLFTRT
uniref:P/Homo B domain-containing protein n=1 Tax=Timema douglasi TaxID=61478 RepID=A0A7R8ZC90_TIMDO|nr:unnamed protein product [Timema douglasi]